MPKRPTNLLRTICIRFTIDLRSSSVDAGVTLRFLPSWGNMHSCGTRLFAGFGRSTLLAALLGVLQASQASAIPIQLTSGGIHPDVLSDFFHVFWSLQGPEFSLSTDGRFDLFSSPGAFPLPPGFGSMVDLSAHGWHSGPIDGSFDEPRRRGGYAGNTLLRNFFAENDNDKVVPPPYCSLFCLAHSPTQQDHRSVRIRLRGASAGCNKKSRLVRWLMSKLKGRSVSLRLVVAVQARC